MRFGTEFLALFFVRRLAEKALDTLEFS